MAQAVAGCDGGGSYDVVVRFDPPALADDARRVEVALVPGCDVQERGEPAVDPLLTAELDRMSEPAALGDADPGSFGLYARAFDAECVVFAAGCNDVELEAGGGGELSVTLPAIDGPGCGPGTVCSTGVRCVPADAGTDATMDASDGGGCVDELCNGADDDCDGTIDEGFECRFGATENCRSCGMSGTRECNDACTWDPCRLDAGDDTLALYPFDGEPDRMTITDAVGDHDGFMTGGDAAWSPGPWQCGSSLERDGTADVYGEVPDSPDWDMSAGRVDFWVRIADDTEQMGLVGRDANGTVMPGHLTTRTDPEGRLTARIQTASGVAERCTDAPLVFDRWHDVSVRFGEPGFELLVGGVPVPAAPDVCDGTTIEGIAGNDNPWVFGAGTWLSDEGAAGPTTAPFEGALDHVRIVRGRGSPEAPLVTGFVLVNAVADTDLGPIGDGEVIDLESLPTGQLNIRANTDPGGPGHVEFVLDGVTNPYGAHNDPPFALGGYSAGDYMSWTPEPGMHTLSATGYSGPDGTGTAGPTKTIAFTVR